MKDAPTSTTEYPPEQYPYRIRNWHKFQHYKKRNPPWIKLHFSILSSEDFVVLDDASKLLAVVCMLIASRHEGHIPASASPSYFKRVAYLEKSPNLKPLIDCGFLIRTLAYASISEQMIADARPETETETETEKKEIASPSAQPSKKGTRLPQDWNPSPEDTKYAVGLLGEGGVARTLEDFRDYWLSKPGQGGVKLDWGRTWKTWCRKAKDWGGGMGGSGPNPNRTSGRPNGNGGLFTVTPQEVRDERLKKQLAEREEFERKAHRTAEEQARIDAQIKDMRERLGFQK